MTCPVLPPSQMVLNIIRVAFLLAVGLLTIQRCNDQAFVSGFCFSAIGVYFLAVFSDMYLLRQTCTGSLSDTARRSGVAQAVSIRTFVLVVELVLVRCLCPPRL